ncbi:MAG: trypsin-like peptidase domain-containing protein [Pseudomonadales bacterium]|jgi:serine peptidase DegS|nr:trypsin-like peptidase domain-containing protein [Pseudomonadales bacterium]
MNPNLARFLPVLAGIAFGLVLGLLIAERGAKPRVAPGGYADAVARAAPAVVNIYTSKIVTTSVHPFCDLPGLRQFCARMPERRRMQSSLGSGIVVRADGHVLTNNHVIADADEILVALADGREVPAIVVGTDPETDLAVLRVPVPTPEVLTVAADDALRVGDVVLAIGNPFGFGQTVSQGIVSALGRYGFSDNPYENFIQTDAAINPGNSGGALVDARGDLVGLNTLIFSRSGGSQGLGFAIPARLALTVLDDIIARGEVVRGWLGVEVLLQGVEDSGLPVTAVTPQGPAARAGLRTGDLIVTVDEMPVGSARELAQRIAMLEPGRSVSLRVRRDGVLVDLAAVVGRRPALQG